MNLQEVINLENTYLGDPSSLRDMASKLSDEFYGLYEFSIDKLDVIKNVFSHIILHSTWTAEEIHEIENVLLDCPDMRLNVTVPGNKAIAIWLEDYDPVGMNILRVSDGECIYGWEGDELVILEDDIDSIPTYSDGTPCDILPENILTNLGTGTYLSKVFGDLCNLVKNGDPELNPQSILNAATGVVQAANLDYDVKNELVNAISLGPKAIVQYVAGIVTKTGEEVDDPTSDDALYNTSVVVSNFSYGMVLGLLVTAGQIAAAIMSAISKVLAVAGAVVNVIVQLFTNIANSISGIAAGATFACVHWNGTPAFNLVLNQVTISNHELAQAIRAIKAKSFTIQSQTYPAIVIGHLLYPDNVESDDITLQEVPSINFSFKRNLVARSNYLAFVNEISDTRFIIHNAQSTYNAATTLPTLIFSKDIAREAWFGTFVKECYRPVSLDMSYVIDCLKDLANSDIIEQQANIWAERLYTSVILWLLAKNINLFDNMMHTTGTLDWTSATGFFFPVLMEVDYTHLHSLSQTHLQMLHVLCYRYASVFMNDDGTLKSDVNFKLVQDALITVIQGNFSNLKWRSEDEYTYSNSDLGKSTNSNLTNTVAEYVTVNDLAYWYAAESYKSELLDEVPTSIIIPNNAYMITDGYSRYCAINLPSAMIASVYLGMMADIAILSVATIATVIAARVALKVKNAVRKKQAEVEAKWYAYQDALTEQVEYEDPETGEIKTRPHTKKELDKVWKDYKKSRMKYNIAAFFTGGTTLGLGLYDDGDSAAEIATPLLQTFCVGTGGSDNQEVISLNDIIRVIKPF